MKIAILTYGSRGDVQPFIALAGRLQQAGHTPMLAAPERLAGLAEEYHVPFMPLPGDPGEFVRKINDQARGNPLGIFKAGREFVFPLAGRVIGGIRAACQGADLIAHSFLMTTGGHAIAREMGIPDVSVQFFPAFAPTRAFAAPGMPELPLGGTYNYLTHVLLQQIYWLGHTGYRWFKRTNPAFPQRIDWPFRPSQRPITPLLFAFSPVLVPRPPDWGEHVHITGFWTTPAPEEWQPPAPLRDFLSAGEPPVCINFGSIVTREAGRIFEVVVRALEESGQRGIVVAGWRDWRQPQSTSRLLVIESAPHDWLFPRTSVVVHHGGAGTTAAALRAGAPNVVTPFMADQSFWGRQVEKLGAGPKPIPVHALSPGRLAGAIQAALTDPVMRRRASEAGQRLRAEDGAGVAVKIIEAAAGRSFVKE